MQVDAFTDRPLAGNPCAIVFEADALDDQTRLAIAREMNLSETAFVQNSKVADFRFNRRRRASQCADSNREHRHTAIDGAAAKFGSAASRANEYPRL